MAPTTPLDAPSGPDEARTQRLNAALERLHGEQMVNELTEAELMPRVLELAREVLTAGYGVLAVLSDNGLLQPSFLVADRGEITLVIDPRGAAALRAVAETGEPVVGHEDAEPDKTADSSYVATPILSRRRLIGCLYLAGRTTGAFSKQDLRLVGRLAEGAGDLLEQARLADLARTRLQWLQAGTRVTRALLDPTGEINALQIVTDALHGLGGADLVMIFTPTEDASWMHVATVCLPDVPGGESRLRGMRYPLDPSSVALKTMRTGRAVRVDDMASFRHEMAERIREVVDIGPLLVAPLSSDAPQGTIVIGRLRGRPYFSAQDQEMAELFANQAAVAHQSLQARLDRSRLLMLEDRERVSRELHDSVIQRLFAVGLSLYSLRPEVGESTRDKLAAAVAEIDQITRNVRHTIFSFEGHESSHLGLLRAVEASIQPLATSLGLEPVITADGADDLLIPGVIVANVSAVVYQIVRGAGRYTTVEELTVDISATATEVTVTARERGLPLDTGGRYPGQVDLVWRAEEFGGSFEAVPTDEGSTLTWTVPLIRPEPPLGFSPRPLS